MCLGIWSKPSITSLLTFVCISIILTFLFNDNLWTLLNVIKACFCVVTFSKGVCCKCILCSEENHQREASSLNKIHVLDTRDPVSEVSCRVVCIKFLSNMKHDITELLTVYFYRPHYNSIFYIAWVFVFVYIYIYNFLNTS